MKNLLSIFVLAGVVAATVAVGVIHGQMTLRWGARPDMVAAAARLAEVPETCGPWRMESSSEMSDSVRKMLRCEGSVSRRYVDQSTGERVDVSIVFGPPGGICEHTPEVCVGSRAFTPLGARARVGVDRGGPQTGKKANGAANTNESAEQDTFWFVDFRQNEPSGRVMRIYWAWSTGETWSAPDNAKTRFASAPHVYKIQLSTFSWSGGAVATRDAPDDPCGRFLEAFLPAAQAHLAPADDARNE